MRIFALMLVGVMIAGCSSETPAPAQNVIAEPVVRTLPEDFDPFSFDIETGRWEVIVDNAREAIIERGLELPDHERSRAHLSLKHAALNLLILRDDLCGAVPQLYQACENLVVPDWVIANEPIAPPFEELVDRSAWISEAMGPFVSAACDDPETGTVMDVCRVE